MRSKADFFERGFHADDSTVSTTEADGSFSILSYARSNAACSSEYPAASCTSLANGASSLKANACDVSPALDVLLWCLIGTNLTGFNADVASFLLSCD